MNTPTTPSDNVLNASALNGKWLDFYALLHVAGDADEETLRKRIGACYAEASSNCDHRDLERRHYYQTMVERVLPQCRRVLLNPELRARYDYQQTLHQAADSSAIDYVSFMAGLQNGAPDGSMPGLASAADGDDGALATVDICSVDLAATSDLPQEVREEITLAREVVECMESGSALNLLPVKAVSESADAFVQPSPAVQKSPALEPSPAVPSVVAAAPGVAAPEISAPAASPKIPSGAAPAMPLSTRPQTPAAPESLPPNIAAQRSAAALDPTPVFASTMPVRNKGPVHRPRVILEKEGERNAKARRGQRVLSPMAVNLMTAIVAVLLYSTIQRLTDSRANATITRRTPLNVLYASELRPVMEQAERLFEKTAEGQGIDVVLQPQDSRSAMRRVLGADGPIPDVWIPAESMWSDRYNQVAGSFKRLSISQATPLSLSPLVLIARSDRAAGLLKRFPGHTITSWDALRSAISADAPGHFGMTDPQRSGSGAITRYFMAREWCERNGVAWGQNVLSTPALWNWLGGFEDNVPAYARMTGDMAKDLVLGTSGRYWWALAYESDAIYWLSRGKPVEIFYLPRTNYADHPYCHVQHPGSGPELSAARVQFERFLRSDTVQNALLKDGFRPTEIASNGADSPFKRRDFQAHGAKTSGFRLEERLNYRLLNGLNAQWNKRFGS